MKKILLLSLSLALALGLTACGDKQSNEINKDTSEEETKEVAIDPSEETIYLNIEDVKDQTVTLMVGDSEATIEGEIDYGTAGTYKVNVKYTDPETNEEVSKEVEVVVDSKVNNELNQSEEEPETPSTEGITLENVDEHSAEERAAFYQGLGYGVTANGNELFISGTTDMPCEVFHHIRKSPDDSLSFTVEVRDALEQKCGK